MNERTMVYRRCLFLTLVVGLLVQVVAANDTPLAEVNSNVLDGEQTVQIGGKQDQNDSLTSTSTSDEISDDSAAATTTIENDDDDDDEDEEEDDDPHPEFAFPFDDFPYYPEEFDDEPRDPPLCDFEEGIVEDCENPYDFMLEEFTIGDGRNIASYRRPDPNVYELFEDFDISHLIHGDEAWKDLLYLRRSLQRPSLSWYVDKIARKRWLGDQGYPQPQVYYMQYKHEMLSSDSSMTDDEELRQFLVTKIQQNLPTNHSFAAKPTHMSMTMGSWLVDHTPVASVEDGHVKASIQTSYTKTGTRLVSSSDYDEQYVWDPQMCAMSLTEGLFRKPAAIESWALHNVHPGVVVEELMANHEDPSLPPQELCFFVIWGRVYVAQWNIVHPEGRFMHGFYYRSGRLSPGNPAGSPEFIDLDVVPWDDLIQAAESLAANKDFMRVDFLVGVSKEEWKKYDRQRQLRAKLLKMFTGNDDSEGISSIPDELPRPPIKMVVSESEIFPTTMFTSPFIAEEAARLWVGGYKVGNFKVVPNTEIPSNYVSEQEQVSVVGQFSPSHPL